MAAKRTTDAAATPGVEPIRAEPSAANLPDWMAAAVQQGVKPEQALALIGFGLMGRLNEGGQDLPWVWNGEEDGGSVDLPALRQRLELVQLALQTGAPLSTAEVSELIGTRPASAVVQRGGLTARRLSRNVWKLSRSAEEAERTGSSFSEGFRRRL